MRGKGINYDTGRVFLMREAEKYGQKFTPEGASPEIFHASPDLCGNSPGLCCFLGGI